MTPTPLQWLVILWFVLSVGSVVFGRMIFAWWIWKRGAKLNFFWIGTPGYLEAVYARRCRDEGRSSYLGMILLIASMINVALASTVFVLLVARVVPRVG